MLDKSLVLTDLLKLFGEGSLSTELYVWKDREMNEIVIAIKKSGILFSGEYVRGFGCLVQVRKVNLQFIVEPIQYNVKPKVETEDVRKYEKTYAEAEPTARLMVTSLEPRNHPDGSTSYKGKLVYWRVIDNEKVLAKQEVSNGAVVDQRMEALQRAKSALYDLISYQKNLVAGPKDWSYFVKRPFIVFLDLENINIPVEVSPEEAVNNIKAYVNRKFGIDKENIQIFAYANFQQMRGVINRLKETDVVLENTGKINDKKDVADKALIYALGVHANKYLAPITIMLASGDVDFAKPLRDLRDEWRHNTVLAIPSGSFVSFALTDSSDTLVYWPNVVRGEDQRTLSLEIRKGKMELKEENPSKKLVEKQPSDATPIQLGGLTDVARGEDQPTSSLQNKKGTMLLVEGKPFEKLVEENPSKKQIQEIQNVHVSVDSQLQLLSLDDVTPIQSVDLTGLKDELAKFLENSKGKRVNLTRLKGDLVKFLGDTSGNRTLLALIRNIGS